MECPCFTGHLARRQRPTAVCSSNVWFFVPRGSVPGPLRSSIRARFLGDLIWCRAFKYYLLAEDAFVFTSRSDLSPERQRPTWHPSWPSPRSLRRVLAKAKMSDVPSPRSTLLLIPSSPTQPKTQPNTPWSRSNPWRPAPLALSSPPIPHHQVLLAPSQNNSQGF